MPNFSAGWYGTEDPEWLYGDFDLDGDVDGTDFGTFSTGWFRASTLWPAPEEMMGGGIGGESLSDDDRSALSAAIDAVFEQYGLDPSDASTQPAVGSAVRQDFIDDLSAVFEQFGLA